MNEENFMKISNKKELKDIITYERKRWLILHGFDPNGKAKNIREINYVESLRYVEYYSQFSRLKKLIRGGLLFIYHRARYNRLCSKNNVWVCPGCFDKGLVLRHCQNIVVAAPVRAGVDCTVLHNVTLGVNFTRPGTPRIGNNVLISCGAGIYGDIEIADDCIIGANSVVTKSCLERGAILAGIPAKVIKVRS